MDRDVWRGWFLPSGFLYKYTHPGPAWDPSKCDLSRCNSIALIMIIASGAVILNLSAFLLVTIFSFFSPKLSYCNSSFSESTLFSLLLPLILQAIYLVDQQNP